MAKKLRRFKWSSLPQLSRRHVRVMNTLLTHFPQTPFERGFKDKLRAALEPILHADVDVWFEGVKVVDIDALPQILPNPLCVAVLGIVPKTDKCLVEVDLATAQACIDRVLGGAGEDSDANRPLSEIEEGVFSFVLLKALAVLQANFGGERQLGFKLEGVYGSLEALEVRAPLSAGQVVLSFKIFVDKQVGTLRVYLPESLIESDFPALWPSDGPAKERLLQSYGDRKEMVRLFRTALTVEVGRLELGMTDLESLDADDIVLVEQTDARIGRPEDADEDDDRPSVLSGQVSCRIGAGAHGTLLGALALGQTGKYEVAIESINPMGEPQAMGFLFRAADGEEAMVEESKHMAAAGLVDEVAHAALLRKTARAAAVAGDSAAFVVDNGAVDAVDAAAEHSDNYEEDEGGDAPSSEAAGLLEDVTVAMVVELGRVMVSAADVMGLRPGQVIELSRAPGEPVDLVVDGKRIGKGELVEIDGELGVRILSLAR